MSYFSRFPLVNHDNNLQVNLTRRVAIDERYKDDASVFFVYNVQDGDTPENIADRFYDDVSYCWIVLQFNDIVNVFEEWPRSQQELDDYISDKYDNPYAIHHYVSISTNEIVSPELHPSYDRLPVTNYEYEVDLNDAKREIRLVLPELANEVVLAHREQVERGL